MESRNLKKLLFDVEKACKRIEKFVSNCRLDDFLNNEMLQSAVERQSEIIGEALNKHLVWIPKCQTEYLTSAALSRFATVSSMDMRPCHPRSSGES